MANISEAGGTITITASSEDTATKFITLFNTVNTDAYYGTTIHDDTQIQVNDDKTVTASASFDGCGRWAYHENIAWTFECITEDFRAVTGQLSTIREELRGETITVTYDFVDYEPGMAILYTEKSSITYTKGKVGETEELSFRQLECSIYNLREYVDEEYYNHQILRYDVKARYIEKFTGILTDEQMAAFDTLVHDERLSKQFLDKVATLEDYFCYDTSSWVYDCYPTMGDDITSIVTTGK